MPSIAPFSTQKEAVMQFRCRSCIHFRPHSLRAGIIESIREYGVLPSAIVRSREADGDELIVGRTLTSTM